MFLDYLGSSSIIDWSTPGKYQTLDAEDSTIVKGKEKLCSCFSSQQVLMKSMIALILILCLFTDTIIPVRMPLSAFNLTPTMKSVENQLTVRYYVCITLYDIDHRRYYKVIEIELWRKEIKFCTVKQQETHKSDLKLGQLATKQAISSCQTIRSTEQTTKPKKTVEQAEKKQQTVEAAERKQEFAEIESKKDHSTVVHPLQ